MKVEIEVPENILACALCSAWEGGSSYWAAQEEGEPPYFWEEKPGGGMGPLKLKASFSVTFTDKEDDGRMWPLTNALLARGVRVMAEEHGRHFGDLMSENGDATTGDVLLQCAVFGNVIYG